MADRRCTGCVCGLAFGEMGDALHLCTESQVGAFVESHVPEPVIFFLYTINPIYSFTKNVFTHIQR
jgi:hypothetical protein